MKCRAGDLASQLVQVLVNDMRNSVGLGSDDAVLLLDRAGVVHGMNRAAKKMAEARFFIEGNSGGLVMSDRVRNKAFRAAFRQFCVDWPEELRVLADKETLVILRPAFEGASVVSMVAMTVRHVQRRSEVPIEKLQCVLNLSPKQALVAQAVMRGLGPSEYAQENGCSVKTARFHLYQLMKKVGCHSQVELGYYLIRTFE